MIRAKKQALLQEDQRQKRLWYLPIIWEYIILIWVIWFILTLMYAVGFVTGQAFKDCPTVSCPVVQSVCELPQTGATIE
jgi:Trk-type K+ transport system membrane component